MEFVAVGSLSGRPCPAQFGSVGSSTQPRARKGARLTERDDLTRLLAEVQDGQKGATDRLFEAVYQELREMARGRMRNEPAGHTLQPTALVHEAYLRLLQSPGSWQNRWHFFAAAAESMRRILIERARRVQRLKRGGGQERADADELERVAMPEGLSTDEILVLDSALGELEATDPRKAEVVKLRFFAGLSIEEMADVLQVSASTVKNDWTFARAWLHRRLRPDGADS